MHRSRRIAFPLAWSRVHLARMQMDEPLARGFSVDCERGHCKPLKLCYRLGAEETGGRGLVEGAEEERDVLIGC